jgi:hypothetical protein
MPMELRNVDFNPSAWQSLCQEMNKAEKEACCYACAVEWCCCLVTGFPFIFCCHPCIQKGFQLDKEKSHVSMINNIYFNGNRVIETESGEYLIINLGYITGHLQVVQPNEVYNNPSYEGGGGGYGGGGSALPVATTAYAVKEQPDVAQVTIVDTPSSQSQQQSQQSSQQGQSPQQQVMKVIVPQGCTVGTVLTVVAPNGTHVSVTVQEGMEAGSEVMVQY